MPFGKHKGEEIGHLRPGYLEWLKLNCKLYGETEIAINATLDGRSYYEEIKELRAAKATEAKKPAQLNAYADELDRFFDEQ